MEVFDKYLHRNKNTLLFISTVSTAFLWVRCVVTVPELTRYILQRLATYIYKILNPIHYSCRQSESPLSHWFYPAANNLGPNASLSSVFIIYILFTKYMKRKFKQWLSTFNNSINIKKMSNHLSHQTMEHKKDHSMWHWKSRSWFRTGHTNVAGWNQLMVSPPLLMIRSPTTIQILTNNKKTCTDSLLFKKSCILLTSKTKVKHD